MGDERCHARLRNHHVVTNSMAESFRNMFSPKMGSA